MDADSNGPFLLVGIKTLEGLHAAISGDWIIRGIKGELYPCKPDIFALTYEPAAGDDDDGDAEVQFQPADAEPDGKLWDDDVFSALGAAGCAITRGGGYLAMQWLVHAGDDMHRAAHEAAAFLRRYPGSAPDALRIHLKRTCGLDVPAPGPDDLLAWDVFALVLQRLGDRRRAAEAAEEAEADAKARAEASAAMPVKRGGLAKRSRRGAAAPSKLLGRRDA